MSRAKTGRIRGIFDDAEPIYLVTDASKPVTAFTAKEEMKVLS